MSESLEHVRRAYEATPRELDERLSRLARGDRGCLPDVISGIGAVSVVVLLVMSMSGRIGFTWVYAGVALWVGGFFYGATLQGRSSKQRTLALEQGPLVLARVVDAEFFLFRPGKRAGRAVVVFSLDHEARFSADALAKAARAVAALKEKDLGHPEIAVLLRDRFAYQVVALPEDLGGDGSIHVAAMTIYPDRLEGRALHEDAPVVSAIVEPERGFIEHV